MTSETIKKIEEWQRQLAFRDWINEHFVWKFKKEQLSMVCMEKE